MSLNIWRYWIENSNKTRTDNVCLCNFGIFIIHQAGSPFILLNELIFKLENSCYGHGLLFSVLTVTFYTITGTFCYISVSLTRFNFPNFPKIYSAVPVTPITPVVWIVYQPYLTLTGHITVVLAITQIVKCARASIIFLSSNRFMRITVIFIVQNICVKTKLDIYKYTEYYLLYCCYNKL